MKKMLNVKQLFILIFIVADCLSLTAGNVVINEIMQSNLHTLMVENKFPDSWIELYNTSNNEVSLKGWRIGISEDPSKGYTLPENTVVEPHGYLLVYADREGNGYHSDFRLDTDKGDVVLFDERGEVVDILRYATMVSPDISYGRCEDGSTKYGFCVTSTPGTANCGVISSILLPQPVFSHSGGIFADSVVVTIDYPEYYLPDRTACLCVTTDGRIPEREDAVAAPWSRTVDSTCVVRARIISETKLSPVPVTHSYIFPGRTMTFPVVSLVSDEDYFWDDKIGFLAGTENDSLPNYRQKWHRPMNLEIFDGENYDEAVNQLIEATTQGGASLVYPQKSLKLYAGKRYGEKMIEHILWSDDKPWLTSVTSFSLRNGGNNFQYDHCRDAYIQRLFGLYTNRTIDFQAYQPAVAYINGKPYGLINMRERSNEDFVESNYPDDEDICMVEDWWDFKTDLHQPFFDLRELYNGEQTTYAQISEVIDINSFLTILIADAFAVNTDSPQFNKSMWKARDGKWRWVMKDMDCVMVCDNLDVDYIGYLLMEEGILDDWNRNTPAATALFRKCLSFPEFTDLLIDRYIAFHGDFLQPEFSTAFMEDMRAQIETEMVYLSELYGFTNHLNWMIGEMKNFMRIRPDRMLSLLGERYDLGTPVALTIDNHSGQLSLNDHLLTMPIFDGKCFANRVLKVTSMEPGYWSLWIYDQDGNRSTTQSTGDECSFTLPEGTTSCRLFFDKDAADLPVIAEEKVNDGCVERLDFTRAFDVYDISGRWLGRYETSGLENLENGTYILKQDKATVKIFR